METFTLQVWRNSINNLEYKLVTYGGMQSNPPVSPSLFPTLPSLSFLDFFFSLGVFISFSIILNLCGIRSILGHDERYATGRKGPVY